MENYTKYRLKPEEELRELLVGKDNIYIVACNKCFKEFTDIQEPEAEEFMDYLLQICKSAEAELEQRRSEFLKYLRRFQKTEGGYEFVRDTYLYRCQREV